MNIGIYIYDNAEVLDFSGPFEVSPGPVTARAGYQVLPTCSFADHPAIDVLIVVGGVHTEEMHKPQVLKWISRQAENA